MADDPFFTMDRASDNDRAWFDAHPDRMWRLRDALAFEFHDYYEPPPGHSMRAIVTRLGPGIRHRWGLSLSVEIPNSGEKDEPPEIVIKDLHDRFAPKRARQLVKQAHRLMGKKR